MLTTCPECHTTFRLSNAQLEARRGLVRCGFCRAVFNAYDTLLPEFQVPNVSAPPAAVTDGGEQGEGVAVAVRPAAQERDGASQTPEPAHADAEALPPPETVDESDDEAFVLHLSERVDADRLALPGWDVPTMPDSEPAPAAAESPDDILMSALPTREQIEPGWMGKKIMFALLSLILLLALSGQAAYFLREPLLAWMPELRPGFEEACRRVGCRIPLSHELAAIRVESSSLETDPEQPNRAALRVSFSNRSRQTQQWPYFVLKLTDWKGAPLAQKAFGPGDYLAKDKAGTSGMTPMSEHEFNLDLDLGGLSASGYEVHPRYP